MPNLVKFREDPDAMLVMALEEYDEVTGKAVKAPILLRDVVGKSPPVTARHFRRGRAAGVARPHRRHRPGLYRQLYGKPEEAIIAELGDLIYRDPESKHWQTADAYLSGNVREKLATAEAAGPAYARNAEALQAGAARRRAARRHRRRPRRPVDSGSRHPGVRRRAVRRRPVRHHRSAI